MGTPVVLPAESQDDRVERMQKLIDELQQVIIKMAQDAHVIKMAHDAKTADAAASAAGSPDVTPAVTPAPAAPTTSSPSDPWHQAKTEAAALSAQLPTTMAAGAEVGLLTTSEAPMSADKNEDELKPMHPKDIKPPSEFSGARKDFMPWHESLTSMLRLRSSK